MVVVWIPLHHLVGFYSLPSLRPSKCSQSARQRKLVSRSVGKKIGTALNGILILPALPFSALRLSQCPLSPHPPDTPAPDSRSTRARRSPTPRQRQRPVRQLLTTIHLDPTHILGEGEARQGEPSQANLREGNGRRGKETLLLIKNKMHSMVVFLAATVAVATATVSSLVPGAAAIYADEVGVRDWTIENVGAPVAVAFAGRTTFVGTNAGAVASLSSRTGKLSWRKELPEARAAQLAGKPFRFDSLLIRKTQLVSLSGGRFLRMWDTDGWLQWDADVPKAAGFAEDWVSFRRAKGSGG